MERPAEPSVTLSLYTALRRCPSRAWALFQDWPLPRFALRAIPKIGTREARGPAWARASRLLPTPRLRDSRHPGPTDTSRGAMFGTRIFRRYAEMSGGADDRSFSPPTSPAGAGRGRPFTPAVRVAPAAPSRPDAGGHGEIGAGAGPLLAARARDFPRHRARSQRVLQDSASANCRGLQATSLDLARYEDNGPFARPTPPTRRHIREVPPEGKLFKEDLYARFRVRRPSKGHMGRRETPEPDPPDRKT